MVYFNLEVLFHEFKYDISKQWAACKMHICLPFFIPNKLHATASIVEIKLRRFEFAC